jgi:hypothetical protein
MKRILTILFSLLAGLGVMGQGYDVNWVIGPNASLLNFRNDTVTLDSIQNEIWFFLTSACISNASGDLLFTCYGSCATDKNGDSLQNGCNLCPCAYTTQNPDGFAFPQAAIFIPKPDDTSLYYLFDFSADTLNSQRPGTLYYSLLDRRSNGGLGAITTKNIPILQGHMLRGGGMTACKHANGRDYWLIMGASGVNTYYEFLITPDSVRGPYIQSIGQDFPLNYNISYSKFSMDGSKFATGIYEGAPILLMDFDRCSGQFSNPIKIFHNSSGPDMTNQGSASLEFSNNGRFLYSSNSNDLTQYDLWSDDIQDSSELYVADSTDLYGINMLQMAPNGKLYASTWGGGLAALHVINNPDAKGDSSDFVYGGQPTLSINSNNVPNLINYNLGPLVGSGCDTIPTGITPQTISCVLRVLPNPANKYAYAEMGMQGNYEFELLNTTGQVIDKKQTHQLDIFDTEHLASGVYFISVIDKTANRQIATKKVVVLH